MKTKISVAVFMLLFVSACREDEPTAPVIPSEDEAIAEATIGPDGGTLSTNDFSLPEYVLGDQDELRFTLSTENQYRDDATILVFTYKDGQFTYLNQGRDITIVKLKDLIDRGYTTLIAVVVNGARKYPYNESSTIDLNIKIVGERVWPWRYVTIRAILGPVVYTSSSGDQSTQVSILITENEMLYNLITVKGGAQ